MGLLGLLRGTVLGAKAAEGDGVEVRANLAGWAVLQMHQHLQVFTFIEVHIAVGEQLVHLQDEVEVRELVHEASLLGHRHLTKKRHGPALPF